MRNLRLVSIGVVGTAGIGIAALLATGSAGMVGAATVTPTVTVTPTATATAAPPVFQRSWSPYIPCNGGDGYSYVPCGAQPLGSDH